MSSVLRRIAANEDADRNRDEYLRRIDAEAVLDHYGPDNAHRKGDEIIHSCLIDRVDPHHNHGDANPSASLNVEKKVYHCYSYGGGDIFWFVKLMEGKREFGEIVPMLGEFLTGATESAEKFLEELDKYLGSENYSKASVPRYHERVLRQWDYFHPYLKDRGISFEAAERLRLGYDARRRRITIPHWMDGVLVGWQARAITDPRWPTTEVEVDREGNELDGGKIPKYKNSSGFPKYTSLYNLDRVRERGYDRVTLVESPMSVAKAETLWNGDSDDPLGGIVASFSAKVGPEQFDLLRSFGAVTVWFDDGHAGEAGALKVIRNLYRHIPTYYIRPERDVDLGDYRDADAARETLASREPAALALARLERTYG